MIVTSIHFTFAADDAAKVEELLRKLRDASVKEPGVIQFDVARDVEDPNVFALWEVYCDEEAVDSHRASEHFQRFYLNGIRPLLKEFDVRHAVPI
jgi:quinol monooxygenase YgiN